MSSRVRVGVQARYKISVSCKAFNIDAHVFSASVARASSSDSACDDHDHEVSTHLKCCTRNKQNNERVLDSAPSS